MDELPLLADTRNLPGVESWVGSFLLLSSAIAVGSLEDTLSYSNVERPNQTLEKIKVDAIRGDQLNSCHALIVQIPLKREIRTHTTDGNNNDYPWCERALPWPPPQEGGTESPLLFGFIYIQLFMHRTGLGGEMGVDESFIFRGNNLVSGETLNLPI